MLHHFRIEQTASTEVSRNPVNQLLLFLREGGVRSYRDRHWLTLVGAQKPAALLMNETTVRSKPRNIVDHFPAAPAAGPDVVLGIVTVVTHWTSPGT